MAAREVYLSPFEAGVLYGAGHIGRRADSPTAGQTEMFRLFCASLMQAGATQFVIPGGDPAAFTSSTYLQGKIRNTRNQNADTTWARVHDAFEPYFGSKREERSAEVAAATRLQYLVADLARSLAGGTSMALVAPLPDLTSAAKVLPPDIVLPARALITAIASAPAVVPVPTASIAKKDVALIAELLQSDAYTAYQEAHDELGASEQPPRTAIGHISARARALSRAAGKHVGLAERVISFLPASAKLVEDVWGKVPGVLAEALVKPLEVFLTARTRLVVYRFDTVLADIEEFRPDAAGQGPGPA
jgi:hypothetical protein